MKPISALFSLLIIALSFSCAGQKVPKLWTPTMKLQASYGGGMMYYSYEIMITDTASYMKIVSDKGTQNYTRKFSQEELNSILAYLAEHRFDRIRSEDTGLTHDKASESVTLTWDYEAIGASENAYMSIKEEYREDFSLIQAYIEGLFKKGKK